MKDYYVYILTNKTRSTLYIGVTNNLERRLYEHRNGTGDFTDKYKLGKLVYYEHTNGIEGAIAREKQLKGWLRKKKYTLVTSINPDWRDLSEDWYKNPIGAPETATG